MLAVAALQPALRVSPLALCLHDVCWSCAACHHCYTEAEKSYLAVRWLHASVAADVEQHHAWHLTSLHAQGHQAGAALL